MMLWFLSHVLIGLVILWVAHALVVAGLMFYEDMQSLFKVKNVTGSRIWMNVKTAASVFLICFFLPFIWLSNWWSKQRYGR
jgi:hypothetical protein